MLVPTHQIHLTTYRVNIKNLQSTYLGQPHVQDAYMTFSQDS